MKKSTINIDPDSLETMIAEWLREHKPEHAVKQIDFTVVDNVFTGATVITDEKEEGD
jgi:hypothetical protein